MRATALLDACAEGDHHRMETLGWRPVMDALRYWKRKLTGEELAPYAQLLAEHHPDQIVAVLQAFAREGEQWRPAPAMILHRLAPPIETIPQGRRHQARPDQTDHAHHTVTLLAAAGDQVCACRPRPSDVLIDHDGVLRCPNCRGLEPGQHEQATT